jgi:hypothetical protein
MTFDGFMTGDSVSIAVAELWSLSSPWIRPRRLFMTFDGFMKGDSVIVCLVNIVNIVGYRW